MLNILCFDLCTLEDTSPAPPPPPPHPNQQNPINLKREKKLLDNVHHHCLIITYSRSDFACNAFTWSDSPWNYGRSNHTQTTRAKLDVKFVLGLSTNTNEGKEISSNCHKKRPFARTTATLTTSYEHPNSCIHQRSPKKEDISVTTTTKNHCFVSVFWSLW